MALNIYSKVVLEADSGCFNIQSVDVSEGRVFVIYTNTSNALKGALISTNNNAMSIVARVTIDSDIGASSDSYRKATVCKIASDKVAVGYHDTQFYCVAITLTDDSITLGTRVQINGTSNNATVRPIEVASLTTDKFVAMYTVGNSGTNAYTVFQRVGSVSGTTITYGTESTLIAGAAGAGEVGAWFRYALCKIATDKFIFSYMTGDIVRHAACRTVSGTTLSASGATLDLETEDDGLLPIIISPTDNTAYIFTDDEGIYMYAITASGTTLTRAAYNFVTTLGSNTIMGFAAGTDGQYLIGYTGTSSSRTQYIARLTVTSSYIATVSDIKQINSSTVSSNQIGGAYSSDELAAIFFQDDNSLYMGTLGYIQDVEEKRNIVGDLSVSWKKDFRPEIIFFKIGVSTIGGNDIIAPSEAIDSQWNKYLYSDESEYLLGMDWEQTLNLPVGGVSQGLASGQLDNTSGRFTPRYLGGSSELFTAVLPRRPFIINAGFESEGVESTEPQFVGLFSKQPEIDLRTKTLKWSGADFINFLNNKYVDNTVMYTGQRSDELIENILLGLGYGTAQYDLDTGINTIPFAIFNKGEKFGEIIHKITQAENAQFYQDEQGILRFENRQHWDSAPHTDVQWELFTSQVINARAPDTDHIINVVEIRSKVRRKQGLQNVFQLAPLSTIQIEPGASVEQFFSFEDPVLALTNPTSEGANSFYKANTAEDQTGTDLTSSIVVTNLGTFAQAVKYRITNNSVSTAFITQFTLSGRVAKATGDLYYRDVDDSSVTAYEERPLIIENDYIHEESWANSYAQMILADFSEPENLQEITILAIASLKVGDLISWQGRHWRVFTKKTRLDPSVGFIQDLTLLQRTVKSYFRIGISLIGGSDMIAP